MPDDKNNSTNKTTKETILNYVLVGVAIVMSLLLFKTCNKKDEYKTITDNYEASIDSLHKKINSQGQEITSTRLILSDYDIIKNKLHTADSTVKKLQQIIDKHTLSATVLNNQTKDKGTSSTTITKTETIIKNDTIYIYPTYSSNWNERWSKGIITASKDSITREIILFNEFEIKQSYQRQGDGIGKYFRKRVPMIEVTNKNPNTQTTALKSFALQPDKKAKKRAFIAGIIIGVAGVYGVSQITK